ncbi:MAG: hypothetical protein MHPDNHAH_03173 [Anaerolineales bacterium]|nr:hypothetical protein [Anaerolineales bacterium]WKZ48227.1 MAG: hypothetical protein QY306_02525 [Anaerolineales bacterium]
MPLFDVAVSRKFVVRIEAQSKQEASELTPFYLNFSDSSNEFERDEFKFEFKDIDMVENEIIEVDEVES